LNHKLWKPCGTVQKNVRSIEYWEKAFYMDTDFPCPLIYSWRDLEALIDSINVERSSENIVVVERIQAISNSTSTVNY